MFKKVLILQIILLLQATCFRPKAEASFTDVSELYPYHSAIENLEKLEIIKGYENKTYRPEAPINRAEFVKIIVETFPDSFTECKGKEKKFSDVTPENWFFPYVCKTAEKNIIKGYPDGLFHPERFLNIAEASKIISLIKNPEAFTLTPSASQSINLPWYTSYVQYLEVEHALLHTFTTPSDLVNRGEVAELIDRISNNRKDNNFSGYDSTHQKFIPQPTNTIYTYPSKISLPALKNQKLEGKDFTIEKKISENEIYTEYEIGYTSNGTYISGIMLIPKTGGLKNKKIDSKTSQPLNLSNSLPLLILNHGYYPDELYQRGTGLKREQDYFARKGYIVIHSDYRGYADSAPNPEDRGLYDGALGYTMDVYNLISALKKYQKHPSPQAFKIPKINFQNIFMLGHSMGGAITQNIITLWPDLVSAAVLYAPSGGNAWNNYARWWKDRTETNKSEQSWKTPTENPWSWNNLSAIHFYQNIKTPLSIFHGVKDAATSFGVPIAWSDEISKNLKQHNIPHQYTQYQDQGHTFLGSDWNNMIEQAQQLFQAHTK